MQIYYGFHISLDKNSYDSIFVIDYLDGNRTDLKYDDIVIAVDNIEIKSFDDLIEWAHNKNIDESTALTIERNSNVSTIKIDTFQNAALANRKIFGLYFNKPTAKTVANIYPNSAAAKLGFKIGDKIKTINSIATKDIQSTLIKFLNKSDIFVTVKRDSSLIDIQIPREVFMTPCLIRSGKEKAKWI